MINKIFKNWHNKNIGLLLIRVGVGAIFVTHGVSKLSNMDGTIMFFAGLGIPAVLAWFVALLETVAGIGMLLGVFTKLGGIMLAFTMLVAIAKATFPNGGFAGSELEIMLLLAALGISLAGPGKYSVGNHACGCAGGKCSCRGNDSHGAVCNHGCEHVGETCSNCNDCKDCADCKTCANDNCKCPGCK